MLPLVIFSRTRAIIAIAHCGHQGAVQTCVVYLGEWEDSSGPPCCSAEESGLWSPSEAEVLTSVLPGDGVRIGEFPGKAV